MPYRQRDVDERPPEEEQAGIVGDLVRQFADPYAFFRELVQNAIDAGSTDIRVDIARDAEGALLFSVSDAGEGMDRDILENKLLVLFRSGKEGVEGKIGKFGIGFVSVLAIKPSVVKVQSTRAGKGHTLHLYADHSYELFEHPPAASGTTVTLVVPIPKQKADARIKEHVQRSRVSLQRWCEHAQIPIRLRVDESAFGDGGVERIDRELQLDGVLCSVRVASSDGHTIVLAGLRGSEGQRAAFYNRGLLLTETEEPLGFPGLVLKVQDSSWSTR
ncbi:MAG: ATP-binding protein [Sandaracinaceae bacterium]|nr:ATP-binding protein [Sandaracinaceae bacterium]